MNNLPYPPLPVTPANDAPAWFRDAVSLPCGTVDCAFQGAPLELLRWGEADRPGILLLHGNRAHARWWSPVAGILADRFNVAALSWSGMGGSGWREQYGLGDYAEEAMAAAEAAGLFAAGPPVIVGHSFGGGPTLIAAEKHGRRLAGAVICDTYVGPDSGKMEQAEPNQPRVYATMEAALARYRLVPPQPCDNPFYIDWIARHSLRAVSADETGGPGFCWRFDPTMWQRLAWYDRWHSLGQPQCPLAFVDGAESVIATRGGRTLVRDHAPAGTSFETIPGAHHHLMLDRPRELAAIIAGHAARMQAATTRM